MAIIIGLGNKVRGSGKSLTPEQLLKLESLRVVDIIDIAVNSGNPNLVELHFTVMLPDGSGTEELTLPIPLASASNAGLLTKEMYSKLVGITQFAIVKANSKGEISEPNSTTIYLIPKPAGEGDATNAYDQWLWIDDNWEWIGDTVIDMDAIIAAVLEEIGDYVASVTGEFVDNTNPKNPVILNQPLTQVVNSLDDVVEPDETLIYLVPRKVMPDPNTFVEINGVKWAKTNVDAPGIFAANPEDAGMFYQWDKKVGWSSKDPMVNSNGETVWDSTANIDSEWLSENDPSPADFRIATNTELATLNDTANVSSVWTTINGVNGRLFTDIHNGNTLFLPAGGNRNSGTGALSSVNMNGQYWSNTASGSQAHYLNFDGSNINVYPTGNRATGLSVRCIAKEVVIYDKYLWVDGKWEQIREKNIDDVLIVPKPPTPGTFVLQSNNGVIEWKSGIGGIMGWPQQTS